MKGSRRLLPVCLLLVLAACSEAPAPAPAAPVDPAAEIAAESARLNAWLDEQYAQELDFSPMGKTMQGDKSDYDKLDDFSEAGLEQVLQWRRDSVAQLRANFDYALLDEEAKTSYDIWVYALEQAERAAPFAGYEFNFGRGGIHAQLTSFMVSFHAVDTAEDLQAYIARLNAIDEGVAQLLDRARKSVELGIRQPQWNYDFALDEIGRVISGAPFSDDGASPLWEDVSAKIMALQEAGTITADEAATFSASARTALLESVGPSFAAVQQWLQQDRANAPVADLGAWALPNGDAYYNQRLFANTTEDITADAVHAIGLAEVARLRGEMETVKQQVGFTGSLEEFFTFMRESEQFFVPDTDEGRDAYLKMARDYLDAATAKLPEYFGLLPRAGLDVRRVEAFREQPGGSQHYFPGAPDGSRNGVFYTHMSDMRAMPTFTLQSTAFHEGIPGHHMQISIAQELTGLPKFRTQYNFTAYVEGWGLYAEALGKDMGLFTDPYSDFGRLTKEIFRAIRLVVDTGIHAKHWTQEEAVQYFLANSPEAEARVRSEIERYIITPGQATAYKIGMMKFMELRQRAQDRLGARFDIRAFHDTVLGGGALPLQVVDARVERWITATLQ